MADDNPFSKGCAWIQGEFVPIGDARIPLLDVGFSRSDVTYDVVAVWDGKFFRLDEHLDRFERSMKHLHLNLDVDRQQIAQILHECVRRSGLRESYVDMIATRGWPGHESRNPWTFRNQFYAYAIPYVWIVEPDKQEAGSHLIIARDTVRIPETSVDPTVKNFHWGDLTRGAFEARERGGSVVVLPDLEGNLTEGPGFNIFLVADGQLCTPDAGVLEGITRRTILELAAELGLPTHVAPIPIGDAGRADEAFMTSTAGGVMPVTMIDGQPLGDGTPGPVTTQLRQAYWNAHDDPRWTTPISY
ncbi:aminotransferase class IV [Candidatus Poriferisodalis sp.]|uniref:aminotransferase class IV n=1 Tax=Candidatus Poriferisodalis sp. TaxID=3101277 RepID=UPI003AF5B626